MRLRPWLLLALLFPGCASGGGGGTIMTADPIRVARAQLGHDTSGVGDTALPFVPGLAGVLLISDIVLPQEDAVIGDRFDGVQFQRQTGALRLSSGNRTRWSRLLGELSDSVLRSAGFRIADRPQRSSDARGLGGVRFTLSARVGMRIVATGNELSPARATTIVDWELMDLAQGGPVFIGGSQGSSAQMDSLEAALRHAFGASIRQLLSYELFRRAMMVPRVMNVQDLLTAGWERPIPQPGDTVRIRAGERQVSERTNALGGTIAVMGPNRFRANGIVLTEDGFAITGAQAALQRYLWVQTSNGAQRPARVFRVSGDLALLELACVEPCAAVPWVASSADFRDAQTVLVVGAGAMGIRYEEARLQGRSNGRWRVRGVRLRGGEAIVSTTTGSVIGVATRTGVLPLDSALHLLTVVAR